MKQTDLQQLLDRRFSDAPKVSIDANGQQALLGMAARGSCRSFQDRPVPHDLLETLCAVALASPTKSDLQQRDIVLVSSPTLRKQLASIVAGQAWVAQAPTLIVFCGNNRRQRLIHDWHDVPFANDHLDALFNATADAAIALGTFVTAAEASGLGCCPISAIRNEPDAVSDLLSLPDHVFPFAGLAVGYADQPTEISPRLPLSVTMHQDRYSEEGLEAAVQDYDASRALVQPYQNQRFPHQFGTSKTYGWSEDKARQYSQPERASFGTFVRAKGFRLD